MEKFWRVPLNGATNAGGVWNKLSCRRQAARALCHWKLCCHSVNLVLSWWIIGRPPHGVSHQWAVVVHYGMRHATGASLSSWFLKAAGLSCSTTTAGSWFQSPTVLVANELRSPDEDAPIALNLNRWFALVLLSAATKPIWSEPTATCPVATLYKVIRICTVWVGRV